MQGTARHAHEHVSDLDTTLDFVNTLEYCSTRTHEEYGGVHEGLRTPPDAFSWLLARHLLHEDKAPPPDDWAALGRVREVRAAFRELIDASVEERTPTPESIETVNELLGSRQVPAIEATADGVRLSHRHIAPPVDEALAGLADALVTKLASDAAERFRVCANDACRWAFYDESRAGRRRWCDMTTCGNRAKAARHRDRAKVDDAPAARPAD
jgi:predicted RNA-binding Zn ribbon-like protein